MLFALSNNFLTMNQALVSPWPATALDVTFVLLVMSSQSISAFGVINYCIDSYMSFFHSIPIILIHWETHSIIQLVAICSSYFWCKGDRT